MPDTPVKDNTLAKRVLRELVGTYWSRHRVCCPAVWVAINLGWKLTFRSQPRACQTCPQESVSNPADKTSGSDVAERTEWMIVKSI